jgi:hypothetical protein
MPARASPTYRKPRHTQPEIQNEQDNERQALRLPLVTSHHDAVVHGGDFNPHPAEIE